MKTSSVLLAGLFSLTLGASAAITVPGADGSDGVLNITADTVIDLSQAVTGVWDANNTPNAGKGIYDPAKWAVVFKYSSVTVAAGKTVTFKNHASRAPVVWLVNGNVSINGTVSLDGASGGTGVTLAEPGPGGFRGGQALYTAGVNASAGFGVGGGAWGDQARGGSYGTQGGDGPPPYGNPSLVPLLGGSGGGGSYNSADAAGGAGGGAILIACANTLTVSGAIQSNGGNGRQPYYQGGGGSGGGIRLVADTLAGSGAVSALGGSINPYPGGLGRIRVERNVNSNTITLVPAPSLVPLAAGDTALLWPPAGAPEVRVVSIGGAAAPADPRASFGSAGADVALPETASTQVVIETTNVEQASQVQVRVAPRANGNATVVNATVASVVSPSPLVVRWTASLPVNAGFSAVQVKVVRP